MNVKSFEKGSEIITQSGDVVNVGDEVLVESLQQTESAFGINTAMKAKEGDRIEVEGIRSMMSSPDMPLIQTRTQLDAPGDHVWHVEDLVIPTKKVVCNLQIKAM